MRPIRTVAAASFALLACTSTKLVQKDGCWVKESHTSPFGSTHEEMGFCTKSPPAWAEDRLSRLVQECMAQADYRWENRALAAWARNEPIPPQESDEQIAKICMGQASQALGLEAENNVLKQRLGELAQDRDSLKTTTDQDRHFLEQTSDKMVTALGEAAKKPAPNATATATAKTDSEVKPGQPAPPTTVVGIGNTPLLTQPAMPVIVQAPAPQKGHTPAPAQACSPRKLAHKGEKDATVPECPKVEPSAPTAAAAEPLRGG